MKKVSLTVPWGQYDPIIKNQNKKNSSLHYFSPKNITKQVCTKKISTDRHDFVLGNFEYIEKKKKI
jgi:hypothetical protein